MRALCSSWPAREISADPRGSKNISRARREEKWKNDSDKNVGARIYRVICNLAFNYRCLVINVYKCEFVNFCPDLANERIAK